MNKKTKPLYKTNENFLVFPSKNTFIMSCNNFVDCLDIIIYVARVKLECESEKDTLPLSKTHYFTH